MTRQMIRDDAAEWKRMIARMVKARKLRRAREAVAAEAATERLGPWQLRGGDPFDQRPGIELLVYRRHYDGRPRKEAP